MKNKLIALLLALVMVLTMVACSDSTTPAAESEAPAEESAAPAEAADATGDKNGDGVFTIAYIAVTTTLAPYPIDILAQFQALCDTNGWVLEVYDGNGDVNTQTEQVASVVSDAVADLAVLFPVDSASAVTYVSDLKGVGIDVITLTSDVTEEGQSNVYCYVGPDQVNGLVGPGAEYILGKFQSGANYVILSGWEAQYDYIVREAAVNDFFKDAGFNQLDVKYCGASRDTAYEEMSALLVANSDIDFVFALSDEFAIGAIQALQENGYEAGEVEVVSLEAFIESMKLVQDGWMSQTVTQTGSDIISKLAEVINSWIAGETIDYQQLSNGVVINADNAAEWESKLPY